MCDCDEVLDVTPLNKQTNDIANKIILEDDLKKFQDLTQIFNITQAKKNILRVMKLNDLLDKVSDQMLNRFENRPGEFSNKDLVDYMNVAQNAIDKTNKQLDVVENAQAITLNQNNQVNINVNKNDIFDNLSQDSKENIMDAVTAMLNRLQNSNEQDLIEIIEDCDENNES